jgi:hypothetical protein
MKCLEIFQGLLRLYRTASSAAQVTLAFVFHLAIYEEIKWTRCVLIHISGFLFIVLIFIVIIINLFIRRFLNYLRFFLFMKNRLTKWSWLNNRNFINVLIKKLLIAL